MVLSPYYTKTSPGSVRKTRCFRAFSDLRSEPQAFGASICAFMRWLVGSSYGFLHQPAEAQAALRKAVSLDPMNPYARAKLGSTLGKAGQYQEAVTELREAVRLKPDLADAHFALGLAYLSLGDRRRALSEVDALSRIDPQLAGQLQDLVSRSQ